MFRFSRRNNNSCKLFQAVSLSFIPALLILSGSSLYFCVNLFLRGSYDVIRSVNGLLLHYYVFKIAATRFFRWRVSYFYSLFSTLAIIVWLMCPKFVIMECKVLLQIQGKFSLYIGHKMHWYTSKLQMQLLHLRTQLPTG